HNDGTLHVNGCTFAFNTTTGNGGALSIKRHNTGPVKIVNSTFYGNSSINTMKPRGGGAIVTRTRYDNNLYLCNDTFSGNTAASQGGVYCRTSGSANVFAESCIFYGDVAANDAPEFSEPGAVHMKNCIIQTTAGIGSFDNQGGNQIG